MSYEIIWEPEALAQAEQFAMDDPAGVRQVFTHWAAISAAVGGA
ncbi:hypothetical protein [Streptomyces sp. NPDC088752]